VSLLIASKLIGGGRGLAPALVRRAGRAALDWDTRQKSRFEAADSAGRRIGVFLPRGRIVRGGDVLVVDDGSLLVVDALDQPILVVTPAPNAAPADAALAIARASYHLGNRHVPLEVHADRLVLEIDTLDVGTGREAAPVRRHDLEPVRKRFLGAPGQLRVDDGTVN